MSATGGVLIGCASASATDGVLISCSAAAIDVSVVMAVTVSVAVCVAVSVAVSIDMVAGDGKSSVQCAPGFDVLLPIVSCKGCHQKTPLESQS